MTTTQAAIGMRRPRSRTPLMIGMIANGAGMLLAALALYVYNSELTTNYYPDMSTAETLFIVAGLCSLVGIVALSIGVYRAGTTIDALGDYVLPPLPAPGQPTPAMPIQSTGMDPAWGQQESQVNQNRSDNG